MSMYQQFFEPQILPSNLNLRSFLSHRLNTEHKDIGPWNNQSKRPTPRQLNSQKQESITIFKIKKTNSLDRKVSRYFNQQTRQQSIKPTRFKSHAPEFIDSPNKNKVYTIQAEQKPYTFRQFQLNNFVSWQKQSHSKNPIEPVFISLLKYKKQKLKNKLKEMVRPSTKNEAKSTIIPPLSNRQFYSRVKRILSTDSRKISFKISNKSLRYAK